MAPAEGATSAAVVCSGVSKTYRLYSSTRHLVVDRMGLGRLLLSRWRPRYREFHALHDLDLVVGRGERVGIVGRNGAGKTTLLKLITGNFVPTSGAITVSGTVQAMMQTGLGFHMEFTGYENIRSALLYNGLEADALEEAVEDVVAFCELGKFLHEPMKTYSLGMKARAQFAVATAIRPNILIIDEVLGAGDAYFIAKSARRIEELTATGCTLLLVSHSTSHILKFCERAIWLHEGCVRMEGDATDVVNSYEVYLERESDRLFLESPTPDLMGVADASELTVTLADGRQANRWPSKRGIKVHRIEIRNAHGPISDLEPGDPVEIELDIRAEMSGSFACRYIISIWRVDGKRVARVENSVDRFDARQGDVRELRVSLGPLLIGPGRYSISFAVYDLSAVSSTAAGRVSRFDMLSRSLPFRVLGNDDGTLPIFRYPGHWSFGRSSRHHSNGAPGSEEPGGSP